MDKVTQPAMMTSKQVYVAVRSAIIMALVSFSVSMVAVIYTLPLPNFLSITVLTADLMPLLGTGFALFSGWVCWHYKKRVGVYLLIGTFLLAILGQYMLASGLGIMLGLTGIILTTAVASQTLNNRQSNTIVGISMVVAIVAILLDEFNPLSRLSGGESLQTIISIILGLAIAIHIVFIAQQFRTYTLRAKLIATFIFLTLSAIIILGLVYNFETRNALTQSTNKSLEFAAQETKNNIDGFYENILTSLHSEANFPIFRNYLALDVPSGSIEEFNAFQSLSSYQQTSLATGYSVLSNTGTMMLDTARMNSESIGYNIIPPQTYINSLMAGSSYISPVIFPPDGSEPFLLTMVRINGEEGEFAGILMARFPASILQTLIAASNNLTGPDSYAILWDDNSTSLANGFDPAGNYQLASQFAQDKLSSLQSLGRLPSLPADKLLMNNDSFAQVLDSASRGKLTFTAYDFASTQSQDEEQRKLIGAAVKTTYQPWVITFVQSQSTALAAISHQTRSTVLVAILIVIGVSILGTFVTQMFTNPIIKLTQTAKKITLGDLNARADIVNQDEIGTLASAFNSMTDQLQQSLAELENRVEMRTADLTKASEQMARRATQLQSVAELAHTISQIKDTDELLAQTTELISQRFGFYHVGVFLLDKSGETAILQAANSTGGKEMLKRDHRLMVSEQSMVGYVAKNGTARIALDVGTDAVHFDNPDLPLTRSEISLPLVSGSTVIGVLDVQSEQASAFTDEDIALLSTLADQVSIAIENSRLFSEINQTVVELQTLQRQYLQQEWRRIVAEEKLDGYRYSFGKLSPLAEAEDASAIEDQQSEPDGLNVPIVLRGHEIGTFRLAELDRKREWSDEEIVIARTIADQVGLALENARLLEATQRRAARDRMIAEITNKMRRATDMDTLIQTAVREITKVIQVPEAYIQLGAPPVPKEQADTTHLADTSRTTEASHE